MRRDGFTNGATYEEIIEMSIKSKKTQYDVLVSNVMYNPDKLSDLREFYTKHNRGKLLTEKVFRTILKTAYKADKTLSFSSGNRTIEAPDNIWSLYFF